jgi:hypothetical protein
MPRSLFKKWTWVVAFEYKQPSSVLLHRDKGCQAGFRVGSSAEHRGQVAGA